MVTLEQVEKLRQYADISYEEAKAALEKTNGDILEAIIILEKENRIKKAEGGYYISRNNHQETDEGCVHERDSNEKTKNFNKSSFVEHLRKFAKWCGKIINKGNKNSFVVMKGEENVIAIPVTVLALFLIFAFWVTVPLVVIGLFFGFRYKFVGPDLGKESINRAIDSVAEAAESLKKDVKGDKTNGKDLNN